MVGISSLVYGLIQAPDQGWTSPQTLVAFAIGIAVLVAFVLWERSRTEPMLDMSFFRNPAFSTATGGMILVFLAMFGVLFLITQYFQLILHYSPLSAALRFLPIAPIMMFVSPLTPRIIARLGHNRTVAAGMGLVSLGFLLFTQLGTHTSYAYVLLCVVFLVSGISLTMSCQAMGNYAFGSWAPAFFERVHQWPKSRSGSILGSITMLCGCIGLVCGGRLSDRWLRLGPRCGWAWSACWGPA